MRYLVLLVSVFFLCSTDMLISQVGSVDFAGKWVLDEAASQLGGDTGGRRRGRMVSKMVVEQEGGKIVVEAFRTNRDGAEVSMVSTYTLDGKESNNSSDFFTSVSVANWSEDGKTLTITSTITYSRGGREITIDSTEIWSLEDGALVVDSKRTTPRGERVAKAVYKKS
jgi:hypothetical protein